MEATSLFEKLMDFYYKLHKMCKDIDTINAATTKIIQEFWAFAVQTGCRRLNSPRNFGILQLTKCKLEHCMF